MKERYYLVIDAVDGCTKVLGEDMTQAIRRYISLCELIISHTDFERITRNIVPEIIINIFNKLCTHSEDQIKCIYTNFDTVYNGGVEVTE